jgi:protein-export membrane protein SecD
LDGGLPLAGRSEPIAGDPGSFNKLLNTGIIEGKYSQAELNYLISTLSAGSLPAQLAEEPISERQVGPQLGAANLRSGLYSCLVGLVVVAIFMVVYYHFAGLIAMIGLFMNLVVILGVLGMMGATFTLPGIAGLVLTIGMAVDANVLIFERTREELQSGKSVRMAVDLGFDEALRAIIDTHATTLIAALFLFQFGTGPVKGFAITHGLGIVTNMFTAVYFSRTLVSLWYDRFRPAQLPL